MTRSLEHPASRLAVAALLTALAAAPAAAQSRGAPEGAVGRGIAPTPATLLDVRTVERVRISPGGDRVLVRTERARPEEDRYTRTRWILDADSMRAPTRLDLPPGARQLRWLPGGSGISYVAPGDDESQVWIDRRDGRGARRVTRAGHGVQRYAISPRGDRLAYTTRIRDPAVDAEATEGGVEVDPATFRASMLRGRRLTATSSPSRVALRVSDLEDGKALGRIDTVSVDDFAWAPDGSRLALTGVPVSDGREQGRRIAPVREDLLLYDVDAGELRTIHGGARPSDGSARGALTYSSPFWSPSGDRLGFERTDESAGFAAIAEVGVHDLRTGRSRYLTTADSTELSAARFHWTTRDTILVEYTRRARRGLFRLGVTSGAITPVRVSDERAALRFSLTGDGRRAAWVEEGVADPPEVFVGDDPFRDAERRSSFNAPLRDVWLPEVESVAWESTDGTSVQGWLIHPREERRNEPPPLLVLVHGGPGFPVLNRFHPYRAAGWLYPVQVFASRGYAVLIPNYRQSDSFGPSFQRVRDMTEEPVHDILSGIRHLGARGVADTTRVGLMGHSHGAWIGPLLAAEAPLVRATSFAEGIANYLSHYGQMQGWATREFFDPTFGATPYRSPEAYLERSPAFRDGFTRSTPTLLEYGQRGLALQGVELATALWRQETPHEFVIYPDAGHGLRRPALLLDSMKRNLRWFARWLPPSGASHGG